MQALLRVAFVVWMTGAPAVVAAQSVEVGGTIGTACIGSDGSICDDAEGRHPFLSAYARWWPSHRIDVGASIGGMDLRSLSIPLLPGAGTVDIHDRSRLFLSGMLTYHFFARSPVRPTISGGAGLYRARQRLACEPGSCGALRDLPDVFRVGNRWRPDVIVGFGLSGDPGPRWTWRAGWESHRFANDENSVSQFFAGAGYRFGRP